MRRKMIGLCEAYKKYGFEGVKRPRYVPDGFCEWCGGELPKRRTSCCCEECKRSFNFATNPAWGSASCGGYRNHIMRRDNYTCQRCGEFHALINENILAWKEKETIPDPYRPERSRENEN